MKYRESLKKSVTLCIAAILFLCMIAAPVSVFGFSSEELQTSCCEEENLSVRVQQNELKVEVPRDPDFSYLIVTFMDSEGGVPDPVLPQKVADGTAYYSFSDKEDGIYYLQLYRSGDAQGTFEGVIGGMESVAVMIEGGEARIVPSAVYDVNLQQFQQQASSADALCFYLKPSKNVQSEDAGIVSKADEITAGIADAYGKVRAIHDWVASYLYFDYDALAQPGQNWPKDALGALECGRTVCEGYANLTTALLRASGIPAKTVIGYALYGSEHIWDSSNMQGSRANHAWTAAFADGRWILMDPTWDSGNYYRDGKYQTSDAVHTYFDSTVEFFSYTHRQSRPDAYDSGYVKRQFTDIDGHWAFDPIRFVTNNDLMAGVDSGRFEPDSCTTQAMWITVLARMSGDVIFDADGGEWYSGAVQWAQQKGVLAGIEERFSPEALIDRQMMAVMLDNYMKYQDSAVAEQTGGKAPAIAGDETVLTERGMGNSAADVTESEQTAASKRQGVPTDGVNPAEPEGEYVRTPFSDEDQIADWAAEAVHRMADSGILQGRSDGTFGPRDFLTRAETATAAERIKYRELMAELGERN